MPVLVHALTHIEMRPDARFLRALAELYNAAIYEILNLIRVYGPNSFVTGETL